MFQFGLFADVLRGGAYVETTMDHAEETPLGPDLDVRRMLVPIGPVAVFGRTTAGCGPRVHPLTSQCSYEAAAAALDGAGVSDAAALTFGQDATGALVQHSAAKAVAFTYSLAGGRVLLDLIDGRDGPIPATANPAS